MGKQKRSKKSIDVIFSLKNFKRFKKLTKIHLKPLTILVGPNGGGKSSLITALRLFQIAIGSEILNKNSYKKQFKDYYFKDLVSPRQNYFNLGLKFPLPSIFDFEYFKTIREESGDKEQEPIVLRERELKLNFSVNKEKLRLKKYQFINDALKFEVKNDDEIVIYSDYLTDYTEDIKLFIPKDIVAEFESKHKEEEDLIEKIISDSPSDSPITMKNVKAHKKDWDEASNEVLSFALGLLLSVHSPNMKRFDTNRLAIIIMYCMKSYDSNVNFAKEMTFDRITKIICEAYEINREYLEIIGDRINNFLINEVIDDVRTAPPRYFEFKDGIFINDYYHICTKLYNSETNITSDKYHEIFHPTPQNVYEIMESASADFDSDFIRKSLKALDIADDIKLIKVSEINATHSFYELIFIKGKNRFNITNLSSGGKQILPIIFSVDLRSWTVAVKQPELHLHPKLQMEILNLFVGELEGPLPEFIVLETHSEHLIRKLQLLIANRDINDSLVSIIYVGPTNKLESKLLELKINERGMFTTPWPGGFFEETSVLNIQLIEALLDRKN